MYLYIYNYLDNIIIVTFYIDILTEIIANDIVTSSEFESTIIIILYTST